MSIRWGKMINSLSEAETAENAGFDCIQPTIGFLMSLDTADLKNLRIKAEICSSPLPSDASVTQRGFNIYAWTEYLKKALFRAAESGCKRIAWNDGRSRVLPLEGDLSGEKEQVLQFLYLLCEISGKFDIEVLIEPLGERRTNFLNSMEEVKDFLPLVGKKNLSSMISLRELQYIGLNVSDISRYSSLITHVQMENPLLSGKNRISPKTDDTYDYLPFMSALREMEYSGVITLPDDADERTLIYCRKLQDS